MNLHWNLFVFLRCDAVCWCFFVVDIHRYFWRRRFCFDSVSRRFWITNDSWNSQTVVEVVFWLNRFTVVLLFMSHGFDLMMKSIWIVASDRRQVCWSTTTWRLRYCRSFRHFFILFFIIWTTHNWDFHFVFMWMLCILKTNSSFFSLF
jgi:hypothetical protein